MRIFHYAPVHFEKWDFRTPDTTGIGGSETCVVETAWRLAAIGHEVIVFAPVPEDRPIWDKGGACWLPLEEADFSQSGLWVLHRCANALDNFSNPHPGQTTWLVCQDVFYPPKLPDGLNEGRLTKLDLALPLCTAQEKYLVEVTPNLKGRTALSSNGIRVDLIEKILANDPPERDPHKIIFTSSPDRGLAALLKVFRIAKEWVSDLKLTAAYGWDNIRKCEGRHWARVREECEKLLGQPGVTWLGRLPQEQLYREFLSAGMWVYPTTFTETSCISCMEAQALGAVPITNPLWALADNVRHGAFLHGDPANDPLTHSRYVGEVLRYAMDPALQERVRRDMIPWARKKFDWWGVARQWDDLAQHGKKPAVSVLTPTIRPEGLALVRDSLASSEFRDFEWLVAAPESMREEILSVAPNARFIADRPSREDDFWGVNKANNALAEASRGDLLVYTVDNLWFDPEALGKLVVECCSGGCVSGTGNEYEELVGGVPQGNVIRSDPRTAWVGGVLVEGSAQPWLMEFNLTGLPKAALDAVGGWDEEFDRVAGMSEKDLALRLLRAGTVCRVSSKINYRLLSHSKDYGDWGEAYQRALEMFDRKHGGRLVPLGEELVLC